MKFFKLAEKPEYKEELASWYQEEWGHLNPNRTFGDTMAMIEQRLNSKDEDIFIGIDNEGLVSSVTLREDEVETKEHFNPWLSSLVVKKEKRKQGFGKATIGFFEAACKDHNIKSIYLFTEDKTEFYRKLGWENLLETSFKGHEGTVMSKSIV